MIHRKGGENMTTERKSKAFSLTARPTLITNSKKVAYMKQLSLNELINQLLDQCVKENISLVQEYDERFDKKF